MNKTFLLSFISITLLSFTLSSKIVEIATNKEIEDSIDMKHPLKYYVFKTEKADGMVKDILITSDNNYLIDFVYSSELFKESDSVKNVKNSYFITSNIYKEN